MSKDVGTSKKVFSTFSFPVKDPDPCLKPDAQKVCQKREILIFKSISQMFVNQERP